MTRINSILNSVPAVERPVAYPDPHLAGRISVFGRSGACCTQASSREKRVFLSLALIWSLSMLDLGLTTAMMLTAGMFESNPLVSGIVGSTNSPFSLAAWKLMWTGLSTVILACLRRRRSAELTAWFGVAALTATTVVWILYLGTIDPQLAAATQHATDCDASTWMTTQKSTSIATGPPRLRVAATETPDILTTSQPRGTPDHATEFHPTSKETLTDTPNN